MPYCPRCREFFEGDLTSCPKCNYDFNSDKEDEEDEGAGEEQWIIIGRVRNRTTADYAVETLKSYDIPAVVVSESGYFGDVGLNLPSATGKHMGLFQIHITADKYDEAVDVLDMILGENWEKAN